MRELTDNHLLRAFVQDTRSDAFAELVRRHADWVYSVARRRVGDAHVAEDVAQAVFLVLARKAHRIGAETHIAGWLFGVTRLAAHRALRDEARRRRREASGVMTHIERIKSNDDRHAWEALVPELDEAVARLGRADRDAILLRFYERRGFNEVATALGDGTTADAARKRVARAVERLRAILSHRGVEVPAAGVFSALLLENTVAAAPLRVVAVAAAHGTGVSASSSIIANGVTLMMTFNHLKVASIAAAVILFVAGTAGINILAHARGQSAEKAQPAAPRSADAPLKVASITPILNVRDVAASIDYYVEKLGFEKLWQHGDGFAAVGRDGQSIFLAQGEQGAGEMWLYVMVNDVDAVHDDLQERGATIKDAPADRPWGMREMIVVDRDGHTLRIGMMVNVQHEPPKK